LSGPVTAIDPAVFPHALKIAPGCPALLDQAQGGHVRRAKNQLAGVRTSRYRLQSKTKDLLRKQQTIFETVVEVLL